MLSDYFWRYEDFFSTVNFRCRLAVCCRENEIRTIKQSVFQEKKKKNGTCVWLEPWLLCCSLTQWENAKHLRHTSTLWNNGENLNNDLHWPYQYTCTVFLFFLFSWKDSEHQQINNWAMFLYLIQDQMLKFRHFGGKNKFSAKIVP